MIGILEWFMIHIFHKKPKALAVEIVEVEEHIEPDEAGAPPSSTEG